MLGIPFRMENSLSFVSVVCSCDSRGWNKAKVGRVKDKPPKVFGLVYQCRFDHRHNKKTPSTCSVRVQDQRLTPIVFGLKCTQCSLLPGVLVTPHSLFWSLVSSCPLTRSFANCTFYSSPLSIADTKIQSLLLEQDAAPV